MGKVYTIALVGRPNVGKSALFNRITGKRKAIVEDIEGVTRDRLYETVDVFGHTIRFVDTGGIDNANTIAFCKEIRIQTEVAIAESDALIFVVDGTTGVTVADEEVAKKLIRQDKPVFVAVNKVDSDNQAGIGSEFYALGFSNVFPLSAIHGVGVADLLEAVMPKDMEEEEEEAESLPKVAVIGRPNVGKSTLMNHLLNENRCVVSDIPGTTRDAIDVEIGGCIFIDTAGIRKKKSEKETVDKYAAIRSEDAIERCDLCVLILDAREGLTAHEKLVLTMIEDKGKGCIIFLNKWDVVQEDMRMEHAEMALREVHSFITHMPIIVGSAKTGRNIDKLFPYIFEVYENMTKRVTTGQLNSFIEKAVQLNHPPAIQGKRLRIYYLTQASVNPPHFVLFVNDKDLFVESYRRYLINQFRSEYHYTGCPIRFRVKDKNKKKQLLAARKR